MEHVLGCKAKLDIVIVENDKINANNEKYNHKRENQHEKTFLPAGTTGIFRVAG